MNGIKISRSKSFLPGTFFFMFFAPLIFLTVSTWAKPDNKPKDLLARIEALEARVADLEEKLANVRVDGDMVLFEGVNVQIVNGPAARRALPMVVAI